MTESPEALYAFLRTQKFKLLTNIIFSGSPGHQILELDYYLRKYETGEIPREGHYLWIQPSQPVTNAMVDVYGEHFRRFNLGMIAHDGLFGMASEITRMVPELGIDVGLSHFKNSVLSRDGTYVSRLANHLYFNVTNDAVMQAHLDFYRLRSRTPEFNPWGSARPSINEPLAELLGGDIDRLAAVHFRSNSGNGGVSIPPETLTASLSYLRDSGFKLVKVGTEPCPEIFSRYDIIDYGQSSLRCFRNDLAILCHCKIALINASGLENIVDLMDIPAVSYARWHLTIGPASSRMVVVPALLFDPERHRILSFAEQMLFFKTRPEFWEDKNSWHFPFGRFSPRVPQADEMLAAVQEAIGLGEAPRPLSVLQHRFNGLDGNGLLSVGKSRVSEFFLARFEAML